ncbi:MAG: ion transporter, partial [Planctomycetota bacterium]
MADDAEHPQALTGFRHDVHQVIFEADTPGGKLFDVLLLVAILASVGALMLESVKDVNQEYGHILRIAEWVFTGLFTLEYVVR